MNSIDLVIKVAIEWKRQRSTPTELGQIGRLERRPERVVRRTVKTCLRRKKNDQMDLSNPFVVRVQLFKKESSAICD